MGGGAGRGAAITLSSQTGANHVGGEAWALDKDMTETGPETAEQRLVRTQAAQLDMLRLAEQMAGVGHFRVDLATGRMDWSDEMFRIHGLAPGKIDPAAFDAEGITGRRRRPAR